MSITVAPQGSLSTNTPNAFGAAKMRCTTFIASRLMLIITAPDRPRIRRMRRIAADVFW